MEYTFKEIDLTELNSQRTSSRVVYYDANCNLCNKAVRFFRKFDSERCIDFISLQHSERAALLTGLPVAFQSIIFTDKNKIYNKSDAVLQLSRHLKAPISWLYVFIIVPKFLRDFIYDFVAKNRYKWFGKCDDSCGINNQDFK